MNERKYQTPKLLSFLVLLLALVVGVQGYYLYAGSESASSAEDQNIPTAVDNEEGASEPPRSPGDQRAESEGDEGATSEEDQGSPGGQVPASNDGFFGTPFDADEWDPFAEMQRMQRHIDRMFAESFNRFGRSPRFESLIQPTAFSPEMDVIEEGDRYRVKVDLPGTDEAGVEITLEDRVLTVKGERLHAVKQKDEGGRYIRRERRVGKFARAITLPGPVNPAGMKTSQEEGVLTIEIPKAKDS